MSRTRWVAFLRGINVGGRRITGDEMVELAEAAGLDGAASYQASGNLVFDCELRRDEIERALASRFEHDRGWAVDVFARTIEELAEMLEAEPFPDSALAERGKPQIGFTRDVSDISLEADRDLVAVVGTEIHWVPHTGVSDADLHMSDFERAVGPATFRTRATIERLVKEFSRSD